MTLTYNIYFEVSAAIFLIILYFFMKLQYNTQSKVNKEFQKLTLLVLAADILDVATAITISYVFRVPAWVNILLNTLYFVADAAVGYQFMYYSVVYVYKNRKNSLFLKINNFLIVFYYILLCLNLLTGCVFSISADEGYVHGQVYLTVYVVPLYLILCSGVILVRNFPKFRMWQKISIMVYLILGISGPALQMLFFPDVLLGLFTVALGLVMMLFTMETPDYQKLVKTIKELRITKREAEKAKEEAERAKETAQEANRAKTEFLANMSHEIRTPINAILGYNEIIMKETKESATAEYAVNVQAAGRTLLSIVNDILDFTNIDKGQLKLENTPYHVLSLLQDAITYAEYNAQKKNLELRVSIDEKLPRQLSGDIVRLRQVFNNLLSNAVKYTMEGYVELQVTWQQTSDASGIMKVAVSDSGIGMKPEEVERISESFARFAPKQTRDIQGVGLGLTIVTRLLKLMDGELWVKSEAGAGSTFSFQIEQPIAEEQPIGRIEYQNSRSLLLQTEDEEEFTAPKARILSVDDNRMNLELFCGILKDTKISVDTAMNGAEALRLLEKNTYHIVFLDHMMPVMDGMETLKEIKERKLCPNTPVIALTANAVAGEKEMYFDAGFADYLSKPIFGRQLKQMIRAWLPEELVAAGKEAVVEQTGLPSGDEKPEQKENWIAQLAAFLDTATGLAYCCDSEEFYKEMLGTYLDSQKADSISDAYQEEDWESYRILVHALKSTSLSIGAVTVSEQAKALEMAAKEQDIVFIKEHHEPALEAYQKLLSQIHKVVREPEPDEQIIQEQREELPHILVVDDDVMNLRIAEKMLKGQFQAECVDSGEKALDFLENRIPDLLLLDLHMPGMDGFEVMKKVQADVRWRGIPIIFLTADDDKDTEVRGFQEGALDFITKPFVADIMIQRVNRILELDHLQKNLQQEVEKQTFKAEERRRKVERMSLQIMRTLAGTIDAKDKYTNGHSTRVAEYAREIARRAGKNEKEQEDVYYMGLLHDIGKIGIPDEIINKTSKLTDEEYEIIKSHPVIGSDILKNISELPEIGIGARWHHERYDGKGYPDGLRGEAIPEAARMIGVADAYDAMASKRSYRDVLPQEVVRGEIEKGKGSQFDPYFADVMLAMIDDDTEYRMREM